MKIWVWNEFQIIQSVIWENNRFLQKNVLNVWFFPQIVSLNTLERVNKHTYKSRLLYAFKFLKKHPEK